MVAAGGGDGAVDGRWDGDGGMIQTVATAAVSSLSQADREIRI